MITKQALRAKFPSLKEVERVNDLPSFDVGTKLMEAQTENGMCRYRPARLNLESEGTNGSSSPNHPYVSL